MRWTGLAPADRVAERRVLLLDAAFELLGTEGWSGTTVRAVCQAAALNPRYFYESFDDLDTLVIAVYDRLVGELRALVTGAVEKAGDEPAAQVRAAVETTVCFVDEDRRRARVLYVEALGNEALNRRRIQTGHEIAGFVERGAADQNRAARRAAGDPIGGMAAAVLVGGFSELLVAWLDGRIPVSRARLIDDASALFLALGDGAAAIAARRPRVTPSSGRR